MPENSRDLFSMYVYLTQESVAHKREVFNLLDLFGELGGVIEVFIISLGIFLYPIARHGFILNATKIFFKARTKETNFFKKSKNDANHQDYENDLISTEI